MLLNGEDIYSLEFCDKFLGAVQAVFWAGRDEMSLGTLGDVEMTAIEGWSHRSLPSQDSAETLH